MQGVPGAAPLPAFVAEDVDPRIALLGTDFRCVTGGVPRPAFVACFLRLTPDMHPHPLPRGIADLPQKRRNRRAPGSPVTALLLLSAGVFPLLADRAFAEARKPVGAYPRVANYYLRKTILDVHALAKWDLVIVSTGVSRAQIDSLRALNPDIKILAYVVSEGVQTSVSTKCYDPSVRVECEYYQAADAGNWWLYSADGTHAADWPGKWDVNVTALCPVNGSGLRFRDWFPDFVVDRVLDYDPGKFDGVFLDDCWELISFLNALIPSPIDLNRDGVGESSTDLNNAWGAGMSTMVAAIRARVGNRYIVMGNGPNRFYGPSNGTMIEGFPFNGPPDPGCPYGYAWTKWMWTSDYAYFSNLSGFSGSPESSNVINVFWGTGSDIAPTRTADFQRHKRFTMGSTLLGDGFYSLDYNGSTHRSLWWETEYDLPLGFPTGVARRETVDVSPGGPKAVLWARHFTNGNVYVNPTTYSVTPPGGSGLLQPWDAAIVADPPRPVGTLTLDAYSAAGAQFHWTHPYAGAGSPLEAFEVRLASSPITDAATWNAALPLPELADPGGGTLQLSDLVTGLDLQGLHYIAIRSRDRADRLSTISPNLYLSSVVAVVRPGTLPEPPLGLHGTRRGGEVRLAWSAPSQREAVLAWRVYGGNEQTGFAPRPGGLVRVPEFHEEAAGSGTLLYRVTAIDGDGREGVPSAVVAIGRERLPVLSAYPNPFQTRVTFRLDAGGAIPRGAELLIFDLPGRLVRRLVAGAGGVESAWTWDGRDELDRRVPAGIYWARLAGSGLRASARVVLVTD